MAGGIFPGAPFRFNIKCIIFTVLIAGGYWYLPHRNLWVLGFLLWSPYIALAWYDWVHSCHDPLGPTIVPFGRYIWLPFKPKNYKDEYMRMSVSQNQTMDRIDHLVGWTVVASLVTWYLLRAKNR
jgi:hypothetical protein